MVPKSALLFLVSIALAVPPSQLRAKARTYKHSSNWAGVVMDSEVNGTFNAVMATFAVPTLLDERGGFSMTIGLDGLECYSALQTGVEVSITDGVPLSKAWYGWWPEYKEDFPYISVSPGDVIDAYVVSTSATTGLVIVVNLSTGNISSVTPTTSESYPLCGRNAEWLVEAVLKDGTPTTLGNFSTARFTDAIACGPNFTYYGPTTGDISAIVQNETFLTFVNTAADTILVEYL